MFCKNCGQKLPEITKNCPKCKKPSMLQEKNNDLKIASIFFGVFGLLNVLTILLIPFAIVEGIIGLILAICSHKKSSNIIGLVINISVLVLSVLCIISIIVLFRTVANENSINQFEVYHEQI